MKNFMLSMIIFTLSFVPLYAFTDDFEGGDAWFTTQGSINLSISENHTSGGMFSLEGFSSFSQDAEAVRTETSASVGQTWAVDGWVWSNTAGGTKVEFGWFDHTAPYLSASGTWVHMSDTITFVGTPSFDVDFHVSGTGTDAFLDDVATQQIIVATPTAPSIPYLPDIKLFLGTQSTNWNASYYNSGGTATTYSVVSNFLSKTSISGTSGLANQLAYTSATSGMNAYQIANTVGAVTCSNLVKYSTYKIRKLPKVALVVGQSYLLSMMPYTYDSAGGQSIPDSYGNPSSIIVSDTTKVKASWIPASTIVSIKLLATSSDPVTVDIIASPNSAPYGSDQDKERVYIYTNLLANSLFSTAADTTGWGWESSPKPNLIMPSWDSTYSDASSYSGSGVLHWTFTDNQGGVKMTPALANWIPITTDWYTVRARIVSDSAATANSHQAYIFGYSNTVGAGIPTSVMAHVLLGIPNVWTWVEAPFYAAATSANGYPQLQIRAGGTGNIYLDEVQLFRGAPTLVDANRSNTRLFYSGGNFSNSISTTQWGQSPYGSGDIGRPAVTLNNGALVLDFAGAANPPNALGMKWTASTTGGGSGIVTPAPATIGAEVGGRVNYNIASGTFNTTPLIIMNLLGVLSNGSLTIGQSGSDIIAAAQLDQLINGSVRAIGNAYSPYYEFQIAIRSPVSGTLNVTAIDFDSDQDDPNFGDGSLFQ